jgi:hypothetical protein
MLCRKWCCIREKINMQIMQGVQGDRSLVDLDRFGNRSLIDDLRLMIFEFRSFSARAPFPILWTRKYLSLISGDMGHKGTVG